MHLLAPLELQEPFWRYHGVVRAAEHSFLLDSAIGPERLGQYSFIGGEPFLKFEARRRAGQDLNADMTLVVRRGPDGAMHAPALRIEGVGDPFLELRGLLAAYRVGRDEYVEGVAPFLSGAVGYFGYEAGRFIEALPERVGVGSLGLPDLCLMFFDVLLVHCHRSGRSFLSVIGRGGDEAAARREAVAVRDAWLGRIAAFVDEADAETGAGAVAVRAHFDEAGYCRAVEDVKQHIFAGDVYQVCLTHRLEAEFLGDPWALYGELRRVNPAPFASFLKVGGGVCVASSSPERFLRLDAEGVAESRPIKGTRPRGRTPAEDEALRAELEESIKERAENTMIVDLVRNDLGRSCRFGSVHVPELMAIEAYATVFQMVSTVRGALADGVDAVDLIRGCFPGGSMTGAPKIEAMKIIDRLEPVERGVYAGAIGYLDFAGPVDLSIVIRTLVVQDGRAYFSVGGAVVADSEPRAEYQETMTKAQALIAALGRLAGGRSACGP